MINCGRNGRPQAIHVDRIRPFYKQILRGEVELKSSSENDILGDIELGFPLDDGQVDQNDIELDSRDSFSIETEIDEGHTSRPKRIRKPPAWLNDYETE